MRENNRSREVEGYEKLSDEFIRFNKFDHKRIIAFTTII